jgi:hypothetical protein
MAVLEIMIDVCQKLVTPLDETLATSIANLSLVELKGELHQQASELLVALSKHHCLQAVGVLIIQY